MSARTIKRGGKSARKVAAAQGKAQRVRSARARTGSVFDSVMAWLPLSEGQLHRIFLAIILGLVAVGLWLAASFAGVPAMARDQVAVFAHDAGFELRNVNVRGTNNLNELKIYQIALGDRNRAMPFVDVGALRERLKALPWVEDARVSRQLPDTLVIDIVERKPVAVLQKIDRLVLIDKDGIELETVGEARAKGKLRLNGPGAGRQVAVLSELLDAAPALRPQLKGAEWVGNRRWNLTFKTGQVLALPEGKEKSAKALMTFAQLDGRNRLLGGKAVAFDMRASDRIYFRLPGRTDALETQARPTPSDGAEPKPIESTKQAAAASPKPATKPKENP